VKTDLGSTQLVKLAGSSVTTDGYLVDTADDLTLVATAGNIERGGIVTARSLTLDAAGGIGTQGAVVSKTSRP